MSASFQALLRSTAYSYCLQPPKLHATYLSGRYLAEGQHVLASRLASFGSSVKRSMCGELDTGENHTGP